MTLEQFLEKHNACKEGRKRAAEYTSLEDAWQHCSPADLLWAATRAGVLTERELRMFAVWCARSVQHLLTDPRSIAAIDVAERHANGGATDDELHAAARAAYAAADAAYAADAYAAAAAAAAADAYAAAYDAADASAYAARDAASTAARAADAARERQAEWIRLNTKPNFS